MSLLAETTNRQLMEAFQEFVITVLIVFGAIFIIAAIILLILEWIEEIVLKIPELV